MFNIMLASAIFLGANLALPTLQPRVEVYMEDEETITANACTTLQEPDRFGSIPFCSEV